MAGWELINISFKEIQFKSVMDLLDPKKLAKAERNAMNTTATEVKKLSIKMMGATFNIKAKRIKKDSKGKDNITVKRSTKKNHKAVITFDGKRPNLKHFSPNKQMVNRKSNPKYKIKKSDSLKKLERGFFQTMKGPRASTEVRNMFQREGSGQGQWKWPAKSRTGPSPKQMYEDKTIQQKVEAQIPRIYERHFTKALDKQWGRGTTVKAAA